MAEFLTERSRVELYELMRTSFSLDELRELGFLLGVDVEELPHATKGELIQGLISSRERRGQMTELLQACTKLRPHITWPTTMTAQTSDHFPVFYQKAGIVNRPPQLLGRQALTSQVRTLVDDGLCVLLYGLTGSGKTALATAIADNYLQQQQGGVIWFTIDNMAADPVFDALAWRLGTQEEQQEIKHVSNEADQAAMQGILARYQPALLVLDNAWSGATLRAILPAVPTGMPVLVTSQLIISLAELIPVEVGDLEPEDALALLSLYAGRDYSQDKLARDLCRALAYHPYALEIGGAILKTDGQVRQRRLQMIAQAPAAVATPFEDRPAIAVLLQQSLQELTPLTKKVFIAVGNLFVPSTTPELLALYLKEEPDNIWQSLDNLVYRSLARRQSVNWPPAGDDEVEYYTFHDLTFSFAKMLAQEQGGDENHLITTARRYVEQYAEEPNHLRAEIANILATAKTCQKQADHEHLVTIISTLALGGYMDSYGHSTEFLELLDIVIDVVRERGDSEREHLHYLVGKRGNAYVDRGQLADARKAYQVALDLAPNLRRQIMAGAVLGKICYQQGDYGEGDTHFARGHTAVVASNNDPLALGFLLQQQSVSKGLQGDYEAARHFASQAVSINEQFRDANPARLLYSLLNLGTAELKLGNPHAIDIHQEGYAIALEKGHLRLAADMLHSLAQDYEFLGYREQARNKLIEAQKLYHDVGDVAYEREVVLFIKRLDVIGQEKEGVT